MELKRKYEQQSSPEGNNRIKKKHRAKQILSFSALYYGVSKYGESTNIPFAIIIATFIFATTIFFFWFQKPFSNPYLDSPSRTLEAFFPFFNLQEDRGLGDMVLRVTMLPIVAILLIALRRKLERRFRH